MCRPCRIVAPYTDLVTLFYESDRPPSFVCTMLRYLPFTSKTDISLLVCSQRKLAVDVIASMEEMGAKAYQLLLGSTVFTTQALTIFAQCTSHTDRQTYTFLIAIGDAVA